MESTIQQSFKINLKIMRILCLYPPENSTYLFKVLAYIVYILFVIPIPVMGFAYFLLAEDIDVEQIAESAFAVAYIAFYVVKLFPFIRNGNEIRKCIHYLELPIFEVYKDKHQEIINETIKICQANSKIFLIFVGGSVTSWVLKPFVMGGHRLPVDVWIPFDYKAGPLFYYPSYFYLMLVGYYIGFATGAADPLIGGLVLLAASQMKILKENLKHLHESSVKEYQNFYNQEPSKDIIFDMIYKKIKQCIDHYEAILDFIKIYENTFSLVVFSQFFGSVLVICFCCLQLTLQKPFSFIFFSMIAYIWIVLTQLYFYCYYGTALFEENNTLRDAIYVSEWYDYDLKSLKALMILIERSKRPLVVTAAKVMDLSLATFMAIIKRSYSLLAVLKSYH